MNELWDTLLRFHREIVLPDVEDLVDGRIAPVNARLDTVMAHLDAMYSRFDRLESEYQSVRAAVARLEAR